MQAELLRIGDLVVQEIDVRSLADDEIDERTAFAHVFELESAPNDPLTPLDVARTNHHNRPDYMVQREFVVRGDGGAIVATAETSWIDQPENRHVLHCWIGVLPDERRRGIATALLRLVTGVADDAGRRLLLFHSTDRVPAAEAFARRIGADPALIGHTNRLLINDVDRDLMERWVDEGPSRATGYSLRAIDGRYPDELVDEIIDLESVMNTAPRDNLDLEDNHWTVEQMRATEKEMFSTGGERWMIVAREESTGRLVGWTELGWWPFEPVTVWQFGTGVRPAHRGHALGKWLKATMLLRVLRDRPQVVDIRTHNADSNDPMLGINRLMGFKPYRTDINWQLTVEAAKAYLASR